MIPLRKSARRYEEEEAIVSNLEPRPQKHVRSYSFSVLVCSSNHRKRRLKKKHAILPTEIQYEFLFLELPSVPIVGRKVNEFAARQSHGSGLQFSNAILERVAIALCLEDDIAEDYTSRRQTGNPQHWLLVAHLRALPLTSPKSCVSMVTANARNRRRRNAEKIGGYDTYHDPSRVDSSQAASRARRRLCYKPTCESTRALNSPGSRQAS